MKKIRRLLKNLRADNGFSLVELIIVIAVMVALVAVLVPSFTKYATRTRDAVLSMAAQDALAVVQSEYADNMLTGTGDVTVSAPHSAGHVIVTLGEGLQYGDGADNGQEAFDAVCGVDADKPIYSDKVYTITITESGGVPHFAMTETTSTD